jgi:hypothetical protein
VRAKSFLVIWAVSTVGILAYAITDLLVNPQIQLETSISMKPDISRLPNLLHWGGRLIHHEMEGLLLLNAVFMGGFVALLASWVWGAVSRDKSQSVEHFSGDDLP